jgi:UbiD family decarboxylase
MPKDLRSFLAEVANLPGEYAEVARTIDPGHGEVTALLQHVENTGSSPVVRFTAPLDQYGGPSPFDVVSNVFASRRRCGVALGVGPGASAMAVSRAFAKAAAAQVAPEVIDAGDAPVRENIWTGAQADVGRLPTVKHFEMDHGPVLTMTHIMRAPDGFYDISFAKTFYKWDPHHMVVSLHTRDLSRMVREHHAQGRPARIINVLGHHPAFFLGSLARNPWGANDYETLGSFLDEPLRLTPSVTWGDEFLVPADAEIIIEAEIPVGAMDVCDPFGEVARLYQAQCLRPSFETKAITFRNDPIMQDVFSGYKDSFALGSLVKEATCFDALHGAFPEVKELHCPDSGCGVYAMYVSVTANRPGLAQQIADVIFDTFGVVQLVVVVDADIDVFDEQAVLWAMHTYCDLRADIRPVSGTGPNQAIAGAPNAGFATTNWGDKVVIDATKPDEFAFGERSVIAPALLERIRLEDYLPALAGKAGA